MDRQRSAPEAVPLALEASRPVGQEVGLVEEDDRATPLGRGRLGLVPQSVPEPGESSLGAVARGVDRDRPELGRERQEQGGLPDLPRTGDELDAARRGLAQPGAEQGVALPVAEAER
jgi:hypothetical protein